MNERIRELAEHCDFYVGNEHYDKSHEEQQRLFMEKFAELIIQECVQVCNDLDAEYQGEDVLATWCAAAIKRHFNIAE